MQLEKMLTVQNQQQGSKFISPLLDAAIWVYIEQGILTSKILINLSLHDGEIQSTEDLLWV